VKEKVGYVLATIATRDAVIGEEWLKYERKWIAKVIGSYVVVVKKDGIIIGNL